MVLSYTSSCEPALEHMRMAQFEHFQIGEDRDSTLRLMASQMQKRKLQYFLQ